MSKRTENIFRLFADQKKSIEKIAEQQIPTVLINRDLFIQNLNGTAEKEKIDVPTVTVDSAKK
jgi:hypothetical protein